MIFCAGGSFQIWLGHINVITISTDARTSDDGKWAAFSFLLFLHSFVLLCVCSSLWMSLYISSFSIRRLFCWLTICHSALFSFLSFESILFYVQLLNILVFLNGIVCVCVCVRERERDREHVCCAQRPTSLPKVLYIFSRTGDVSVN